MSHGAQFLFALICVVAAASIAFAVVMVKVTIFGKEELLSTGNMRRALTTGITGGKISPLAKPSTAK